jgi:hypothetical protein
MFYSGNRDLSGNMNWREYINLSRSNGNEEVELNGFWKVTPIVDISMVKLMRERKNAQFLPWKMDRGLLEILRI